MPRAEPQVDGQTPVHVPVQMKTLCRWKDLLSFHRRAVVVWRDPGELLVLQGHVWWIAG